MLMGSFGCKKTYQYGLMVLGLTVVNSVNAEQLNNTLACYSQSCLAEVTVTTATKTPRKLADVPIRTEVVTHKELISTHAKDLTEALRYVPGIQLKPIHGKTGYGVWLQGLDADRVLILVDGNPVSASTGSAVDTSQISVADIERIEVIKGAVSALYGTSAMGGVVNIITKQSKDPVSASLLLEGGSWGEQDIGKSPFNNRHLSAQGAINQEKFSVSLTGDIRESDGYQYDKNRFDTQGWAGHKANLSAKLQYRFSPDFELTLTPRVYQENISNVLGEFKPGIGDIAVDSRERAETRHLSAKLERTLDSGISWQLNTMLESFTDEVQKDVVVTNYIDNQRDSEINHKAISGQVNLPLGDSHLLTVGVQASADDMQVIKSTNNGTVQQRIVEVRKKSIHATELFAQNSWFVTEQFELLPGFRVHHDDDFGEHISPMVNGMWQVADNEYGQFNLRGGVGNGYRIPNLKERYYEFDHSELGYMVIGNPDLKPENSMSYQVSLEWVKPKLGRLELSAFRNDIKDLIQTSLDPDASAATNLSIYNYQNLSKARTQGFDLATTAYLTDNLKVDLSYGYLQAKDLETNSQLTGRPQNQIKVGVNWQTPLSGLDLALKGNFQSTQFEDSENTQQTPSFMTWDFKLNYQFHKDWTGFAGINNLSDVQKNFTQADSRPEEGRYSYVGIRWTYP